MGQLDENTETVQAVEFHSKEVGADPTARSILNTTQYNEYNAIRNNTRTLTRRHEKYYI